MTWNLPLFSRGICRINPLHWVCSSLIAIALTVGCESNQSATPNALANHAIPESTSTLPAPKSNEETEQSRGETKLEPKQILVRVTVSGFKQSEGACRIAVYMSPNHFNDPEFAIVRDSVEIQDGTASLAVTVDIPQVNAQADGEPIRLAVSAYHDQNGNSQLDKNSFGIPTELYGFSKNPKRGFGPPKFNDVAVDMKYVLMSGEPFDVPITVK